MNSIPGQANLVISTAFVGALAAHGLRHAVICPGSRSTPLAVAFAAHPAVRDWMHVDERSAAFFALGMARALGEPVAVLCTSGTAAANFLPAVVEAKYSRVALIVLTADRPPELRDWGAAQTIDQLRLYGEHAKWFVEMPVPGDDPALRRQAQAVAARAMQTAAAAPAGAVHINFPFREPLLPAERNFGASAAEWANDDLQIPGALETTHHWNAAINPPLGALAPDNDLAEQISAMIRGHERGVIVCGPGESRGLPRAAAVLSAVSGYPILADPLSGLRFGEHVGANVIDAYDAFLRDPHTAATLAPVLVVRAGAVPTSKPLQSVLAAGVGRPHITVDPGEPRDPLHLASQYLQADPAAAFMAIADRLDQREVRNGSGWAHDWARVNGVTRQAIGLTLASCDEPFEGRAAAELAALLPDGATLVAGNSMPVRDIDTFVAGDRRRITIVGNRGASGIDGLVSSALGAAAVSSGPVALLVGDLSFYHDMNGLLAAKLHDIDCTIVVLNNDGGGIFSFLPQAELLDHATFERLFGTPTGLDFQHAAELYGGSFARPATWSAFRREICRAISQRGLSIVELVSGRERNVARHREVWAAVSEALRESASRRGDHA